MTSSPPPSPVSPPSQETFERVLSLQRRVEPDHENHITSSFSVLDINNNTLVLGSSSNLEIYSSRFKKPLGKNATAQSDSVYEGNMTCFSLAGTGSNLDYNLTLSPTTPQENYPLTRNSTAILSDSRVKNQLQGNSSSPSTPKSPSSIYSHSLLQPICKSWQHNKEVFTDVEEHRCTSYSWTRKQVVLSSTGKQTSVKAGFGMNRKKLGKFSTSTQSVVTIQKKARWAQTL